MRGVTTEKRSSFPPINITREILKPDTRPDWSWIASVVLQNRFVRKEKRKKGGPAFPIISMTHESQLVLQKLQTMVQVGQQPRRTQTHTLKDKTPVYRWEWQITGQLEVYWFLTNIRRFARGQQRRDIEESIQSLDAHLITTQRLRRYGTTESGRAEENYKSPEMDSPGFLERTHL